MNLPEDNLKIKIGIVMPILNEAESLNEMIHLTEKFNKDNQGKLAYIYPVIDLLTSVEVRSIIKKSHFPFIRPVEVKEANGPVFLYTSGYEEAIGDGNEFISEIDAGGSHPYFILFEKLKSLKAGECGYFSTRFKEGGGFIGVSLLRRSISKLATIFGNLIYQTPYSDLSGGMKITRSALAKRAINQTFPKGGGWQVLYKISLKNENIKEFPIIYRSSTSSFKLKWTINAMIALLTYKKPKD